MANGDDGKTKAFESAQALFCAMADKLGVIKAKKTLNYETYKTYKEFKSSNEGLIKESFEKVEATGISLQNMESILENDNDWYKSSINIAVKLIEDIEKISGAFVKIKKPGWTDFFYYRGSKGGNQVMENIAKLFSVANKNQEFFGDINKWSPADIYFASQTAKTKINEVSKSPPQGFNFVNLNELINELIDSGNLLGISLKKSPNKVEIKKINFERGEGSINQEILKKIQYLDISQSKEVTNRDIKIYFGSSKNKPYIKIRHDPHSESLGANLAIKCEVEAGAGGRGGSLVGFGEGNSRKTGFTDLWARIDPAYAKKTYNIFKNKSEDYKKAIKTLNEEYKKRAEKILTEEKNKKITIVLKKDVLKKIPCPKELIEKIIEANPKKIFEVDKNRNSRTVEAAKKLKANLYHAYKNERIKLSIDTIVSSYETSIKEYFANNNVEQETKDNIIREVYMYVASMSPQSGKYIIAS